MSSAASKRLAWTYSGRVMAAMGQVGDEKNGEPERRKVREKKSTQLVPLKPPGTLIWELPARSPLPADRAYRARVSFWQSHISHIAHWVQAV
jgi:hypothetical protein